MNDKRITQADITIIGAGSAGLSVAAGAAQLGLKTILIEKDKMGGDCLNTGCVPSKALLAAAKKAQEFRTAQAFGISNQEPDIDFSAVKDHVFGVIGAIAPNDSVERFEGLGAYVIKGEATFLDSKTITVNGEKIQSRYFVIATGSRAAIPPINGLDREKVFTNENIFDLREKPDHLIIIGGGPIGLEMAQAHRRLGVNVTVLDIGSILPKDDLELVDIIRQKLKTEGVTLHEKIGIQKIVHHDGYKVTVLIERDGQTIEVNGSHLLVAAGRLPNIDGLNLENAGIRFDKRGIAVNASLQTSNKRVFALGDVAGGPQFTHIAGYHAGIFIQKAVFKSPFAKVDYRALPWVTYTDPELANVGMTESMARSTYGDAVKILHWSFGENDRAQAEHATKGMIKVVLGPKGRILGAGIAGKGAGELLGLWGLAIQKNMTIKDVATTIAPYPTVSEVSKRAAGSYFTPLLFSEKTKTIVGFLKYLPF